MPEPLIWHDHEYGSPQTALLSRGGISFASNSDPSFGTGTVSLKPRVPFPTRVQVLLRLAERKVHVRNPPDPMPAWFAASLIALVDLLSLPPGWSSHSAKKIELRNVMAAIELLGIIMDSDVPPPTVVPRVKGNLQLEWHTEQVDVEIYIDAPSAVRFFAEDVAKQQVTEGSLSGHEQELKSWLKRLSPD